MAIAIEVAHRDPAAVIVQVRLEIRSLLAGQEVHLKVDPCLLGLVPAASRRRVVVPPVFPFLGEQEEAQAQDDQDQEGRSDRGKPDDGRSGHWHWPPFRSMSW